MQTIDELKANPEAYRIYASRVELSQSGGGGTGHCPFHADERSSFSVFQSEDGCWMWKCHGSCNAAGNVVQFLSKLENTSLSQAAKKVAEELSGTWSEGKARVERIFKPMGKKPYRTLPVSLYQVAEQNLPKSKEAIAFLESRGIPLEVARRLHVGFTQDISKFVNVEKADLGIADKGWIMFGVIEDDQVVSIKYRSVVRKAFYRHPGMETTLWNAERIDLFEPVFVVEGEIDVLSLEAAGYRAVSVPSANIRVSPKDLDKIAAASRIFLAGDVDSEDKNQVGQQAMERIRLALPSAKMIVWEGAKDANEVLVQTCGRDISVFRDVVENLTKKAVVCPMKGVYDVSLGLSCAKITKPAENPRRLRFPWKNITNMVTVLPGNVLNISSSVSGTGKTNLVNQIVMHHAKETGEVVLLYQCELSVDEMYTLITAHVLQKDKDELVEEDYHKAAKKVSGYYIGRDDDAATVVPVLDLIELAIVHLGASVVVLDPFHFVCRNVSDKIKTQEDASQRIKRMAQKYGVKFLVVGHPRKSDQTNRGRVMDMEDWKGAGSGGDDCDAFMVLHRDYVAYEESDESSHKGKLSPVVDVYLKKGRSSKEEFRHAKLLFMGNKATFGEMTEQEPPPQAQFFA